MTDYDLRKNNYDADNEALSLEDFAVDQRIESDDLESAESFDLPGADLSKEEIYSMIKPKQSDEFTCSTCYLIRHKSQLASDDDGSPICKECA